MKTSFSRRELYALGEVLGDSVTRKEGGRIIYGGGGGGGGRAAPAEPTSTKVENTNIPDYAKPYVETMLGSAQQQVYNYEKDPVTGAMTPTTIKPFVPYSQNAQDYIAPFSPLQNQAMTQRGRWAPLHNWTLLLALLAWLALGLWVRGMVPASSTLSKPTPPS